MKALKSDLAKTVLAGPAAKVQLRAYLANKGAGQTATRSASTGTLIEVRFKGKTVRVKPVVVPKAT